MRSAAATWVDVECGGPTPPSTGGPDRPRRIQVSESETCGRESRSALLRVFDWPRVPACAGRNRDSALHIEPGPLRDRALPHRSATHSNFSF